MKHSDLRDRARETLHRIANAALATVTPDGQPWNTPVCVAFDNDLSFYWLSSADSVHSQNIHANQRVSLVIFDSCQPDASGHGVYVDATALELSEPSAIRHGLECIYARRHEDPKPVSDFLGVAPQRVYRATPLRVWTNRMKQTGSYYCDERIPVDLRERAEQLNLS